MDSYSGVYTIQNTVSGKMYIGSAQLIRRRFAQHRAALQKRCHQNKHLQAAWDLYGSSAFTFTVTLVCRPEDIRYYEQRLLDGLKPEYNQSTSAYSGIPIGGTCSNEHKLKVGAASVALWAQTEYRTKVTAAIQQSMTPVEKSKRSARASALWADKIYRAKAIDARKGNAYNKGYKCTPEQVLNRQRAARISNMKRNYGTEWAAEYTRRYPEFAGDVYGK
jgi:group I intron endonuclease